MFNYTTSWEDPLTILTGGNFTNEAATTSDDTILIRATGDIILNQDIATNSSTANALVLSAGDDFINNAGSDALSATNSRWLVYSDELAGNTVGDLNAVTNEYNKTYASDAPGTIAAGNRYIYAGAAPSTPPSGGSGSSSSSSSTETETNEVADDNTINDTIADIANPPATPVVEEENNQRVILPLQVEKVSNGSDENLRERTGASSSKRRLNHMNNLFSKSEIANKQIANNGKIYIKTGIDNLYYHQTPDEDSLFYYDIILKENSNTPSKPSI